MSQIHELSIYELHEALAARRLSATDIAAACLERIDGTDRALGCFLHVASDRVMAEAAGLDRELGAGTKKVGPLTGIPVAVKDNMVTLDAPTTCGSKILQNYRSPYDATVVTKLKSAGALLRREDQLRRIRHGFEHREFGLPSDSQSLGYWPGSWRIEWRFCGSGRGFPGAWCAGKRHRWFDPAAGRLLRRGRAETDLRPGLPLWAGRIRLIPGPDWPAGARHPRRRAPARCHCRT